MSLRNSTDTVFNKRSKRERKSIYSRNPLLLFTGSLVIIVIAVFIFTNYSNQKPKEEANPVTSDKSIAVLPIKDINGDKTGRVIADGMSETILYQLSQINDLKVISRTSSEKYRESAKSLHQIAKELEASYILEGSVQENENNYRITMQLIDARQEKHLWSSSFDYELKNGAKICSEIAKQIELEMSSNSLASAN